MIFLRYSRHNPAEKRSRRRGVELVQNIGSAGGPDDITAEHILDLLSEAVEVRRILLFSLGRVRDRGNNENHRFKRHAAYGADGTTERISLQIVAKVPSWQRTILEGEESWRNLVVAGTLFLPTAPGATVQPRSLRVLHLPNEIKIDI